MKSIELYFDYAAATPLIKEVKAAMQPYLGDRFYNPSALYLAAQSVSKDVLAARASVAGWLGARPSEIIFTAGGTEANNLAIYGVMQQFPGSNLAVSAIEHESILEPARQYKHKVVPVLPDGIVDSTQLLSLIDDQTVLVSIMYANNEVGSVQPIHTIAQELVKIRSQRAKKGNKLPLYLHTDACQAANYLDLHAKRLGVDFMTINAGKIYGPKQCGALFVRAGIELQPQILGGGQERGLRSGTQNVANIIGLAKALDIAQTKRASEAKRLQALQKLFIDELAKKLPKAQVNGSLKHRLPNNVNIMIPGVDNERLLMELDEQGIQCATGSACSAANTEPSHVLAAIGLKEPAVRASLRFTMGRFTTEASINHLVTELAKLQ